MRYLLLIVFIISLLPVIPTYAAVYVEVYRILNPDMKFYHNITLAVPTSISDPMFYYLKWKLNYTIVNNTVYVLFPVIPPGTSYLYVGSGGISSNISLNVVSNNITIEYIDTLTGVDLLDTSVGSFYGGYNHTYNIYGKNDPEYSILFIEFPSASDYIYSAYNISLNLPSNNLYIVDENNVPQYYYIDDDGLWLNITVDKLNKTYYIYYNGTGTYMDPDKIFIFYDDFDRSNITDKWYLVTGSWDEIQVGDSVLYITSNSIRTVIGITTLLPEEDFVIEAKVETNNAYMHATYIYGLRIDADNNVAYYWISDGTMAAREREAGNYIVHTGLTMNDITQWHIYKTILIQDTDAKFYQDNNLIIDMKTYIPKGQFEIRLVGADTGYGDIISWDWIRVYPRIVLPIIDYSLTHVYEPVSIFINYNYSVIRSYYLYNNDTVEETTLYDTAYVPANVSEYHIIIQLNNTSISSSNSPNNSAEYSKYYDYEGNLLAVTLYNVSLYGGDEYYGSNKIVSGLIETRSIDSNWVNLGTSYSSLLVQYYIPPGIGCHGGAFYEGGSYEVVGYYIDASGTDKLLYGARYVVDSAGNLQSIKYIYTKQVLENYESYEHYAKIILYNSKVYSMIYATGSYNQWLILQANYNNTAAQYLVFEYMHPSNILVMKGDYLRFSGEVVAVKFNGVDDIGNIVDFTVMDNSPQDNDPSTGTIRIDQLPYLYPLKGNLTLYFKQGIISGGEIPVLPEPNWINISWNSNVSSFNIGSNTTLINSIVKLLGNPYTRIMLGILPLLMLLYPNRKYGALMGLVAVSLLAFFNTVAVANGYQPVVAWPALSVSIFVLLLGLMYETRG